MGGEPYSIGSVVAKYSTQRMLVSTIAKVFGREISNTRIYFFDGRAEVLGVVARGLSPIFPGRVLDKLSECLGCIQVGSLSGSV